MTQQAIHYFNPQDYTACKELREAYIIEAEGNLRHAILGVCLDMAALDAYMTELEQLAVSHGVDVSEFIAARPRSPGFRLPPRISPEKGRSGLAPETEWADEVRRRLQAWTGHGPSPARVGEFKGPRLISDKEN